jgi:hypothetical protein
MGSNDRIRKEGNKSTSRKTESVDMIGIHGWIAADPEGELVQGKSK